MDVVVVVGSLRRGSYNRMLARAAIEEAPAGIDFRTVEIEAIPPFNEDVRSEHGEPQAVQVLKRALRDADGVLVSSPEYNHSIPGVLKNVIDWASYGKNHPFAGKPMAIMGASTGSFGTVRMQAHLRLVLSGLGALVLPKPEVMVREARTKFDESGRLVDDTTRQFVHQLVAEFAEWARRAAEE